MSTGAAKVAAEIGLVFGGVSGMLYVALDLTGRWEQARTGKESFGVLFMLFGMPMVICAGAAVLSLLISAFLLAYQRFFLRQQTLNRES